MSSEKLMNKSNDNEEEDELIRLRMAALESMHNKSNKNKEHTNSSSNNNNDVKVNHISDYKTRHLNNNNNYYSRNASKRSNLIVLTASETEFIPKNTSNSKRETFFTQLIQKSSNESPELSSKRKRVLPGRFSRLEREDNTDEESEEYSDDNEDSIHLNNNSNDMLSAFNEELLCTESDNTITDVLLDTDHNLNKNGLNKQIENSITSNPNVCTNTVNNYNNSLNIESNNEMTSSNEELDKSMCSASTSTKVINNYTKLNSESKKDMIKLNITNNKISGSDILERRKQKFGDSATHEMITDFDNSSQSSENANNHIINSINTNNKLSIKNRLSVNSIENEKNVYSKTCRHRNDSKHSNIKGIEKSCGYNTRLNREIDSETEQDFDDNHSTKKKLRSLVVMKTE